MITRSWTQDRMRAAIAATFAVVVVAILPATIEAQLIPIRTVPVASGDQFLLYPSEALALGGTRIALDDRLLDPFVNPAKGSRIREVTLTSSPVFYAISNDNGSGRTLPIAILAGSDRWFGGGSFALQELIAADRDRIFQVWWGPQVGQTLREQSATNLYMHGYLGRRLGEGGLSLAGSLGWASFGAIDGVEHLYALSQRIDQSGSSVDLRLGLLGEMEDGQTLEAVLVHHRFDATHDVRYLDNVWSEDQLFWQWVTRIETNRDRTHTTGAHLQYTAPLTETGWRVGTTATVNRKSHPKIPNYEIQNIPRDPGKSWAYDFGVGLSRIANRTTYGIDVVFEPIWSDTWAEATSDTVTASGATLRAGEKTVENEFFFSNAILRMGVGRDFSWGGIGLGIQLRAIRYDLEQFDHVEEERRTQRENWMEWTPSWGATVGLADLELRYLGRVTTGTGRPGVEWSPTQRALNFAAAEAASDFLLAPEAPLTLQDAWVLTNQLSVSIPVR
jgi:hypothetical protein